MPRRVLDRAALIAALGVRAEARRRLAEADIDRRSRRVRMTRTGVVRVWARAQLGVELEPGGPIPDEIQHAFDEHQTMLWEGPAAVVPEPLLETVELEPAPDPAPASAPAPRRHGRPLTEAGQMREWAATLGIDLLPGPTPLAVRELHAALQEADGTES